MSARSKAAPVVGFVCEGSTDIVVLRALAEELIGPIDARALQPSTDELDRTRPGGRVGWSEVKAWCERLSSLDELFAPLVGDPLDLLIVALDLDIAVRAGIEKQPANLSAYDAKRLCDVVKGWLPPGIDHRVLIAVPVMAVEAWVLAALFPRLSRPEQQRDPALLLVARKRMVMGTNGPWKRVVEYRKFATVIGQRLKQVRGACREADRYARNLQQWAFGRGLTLVKPEGSARLPARGPASGRGARRAGG